MDQEEQREVSHQLFNNSYMLEVGTAIAQHPKERFTQQDMVAATSLDKALVRTVLVRLDRAGFIEALPRDGQKRPFYRTPSVLWQHFEQLHLELAEDGGSKK